MEVSGQSKKLSRHMEATRRSLSVFSVSPCFQTLGWTASKDRKTETQRHGEHRVLVRQAACICDRRESRANLRNCRATRKRTRQSLCALCVSVFPTFWFGVGDPSASIVTSLRNFWIKLLLLSFSSLRSSLQGQRNSRAKVANRAFWGDT
jgi:hypothetical protein